MPGGGSGERTYTVRSSVGAGTTFPRREYAAGNQQSENATIRGESTARGTAVRTQPPVMP
jgi:hypothetical protein